MKAVLIVYSVFLINTNFFIDLSSVSVFLVVYSYSFTGTGNNLEDTQGKTKTLGLSHLNLHSVVNE
jgi:hypothetical protein